MTADTSRITASRSTSVTTSGSSNSNNNSGISSGNNDDDSDYYDDDGGNDADIIDAFLENVFYLVGVPLAIVPAPAA